MALGWQTLQPDFRILLQFASLDCSLLMVLVSNAPSVMCVSQLLVPVPVGKVDKLLQWKCCVLSGIL